MENNKPSKIYFAEEQKFNFLLIWPVIGFVSVLQFYAFYKQIIMGEPFGNNPAPDFLLIILLIVVGIGLPLFFYMTRLKTVADNEAIRIRFFPIHRAEVVFNYSEIKNYEKRTYKAFSEFGGWGIRTGYKIKAYTMRGKDGVQIELVIGKKYLIGSQKADEFYTALKSAMDLFTHG